MPYYDIEQYEVHVNTFRVGAATPAEAIAKLRAGGMEGIDNASDYVEECLAYGQPVARMAEDLAMPSDVLLEQLVDADVELADTETLEPWVKSICKIRLSDDQSD